MVRYWIRERNGSLRIQDKHGRDWHFQVLEECEGNRMLTRVFFWDEKKDTTGMAEFDPSLHWSKLRQRMTKLAKEADYRHRFICPLRFPLERFY